MHSLIDSFTNSLIDLFMKSFIQMGGAKVSSSPSPSRPSLPYWDPMWSFVYDVIPSLCMSGFPSFSPWMSVWDFNDILISLFVSLSVRLSFRHFLRQVTFISFRYENFAAPQAQRKTMGAGSPRQRPGKDAQWPSCSIYHYDGNVPLKPPGTSMRSTD